MERPLMLFLKIVNCIKIQKTDFAIEKHEFLFARVAARKADTPPILFDLMDYINSQKM